MLYGWDARQEFKITYLPSFIEYINGLQSLLMLLVIKKSEIWGLAEMPLGPLRPEFPRSPLIPFSPVCPRIP